MEFATASLGTLLPKLAELLKEEYNLQAGARKGIKFLHEELERTHAALRELGQVPLEDLSELARLWARDVREVSYDMEDIVDTFVLVRVQGGAGPPSKRSAKRFIKKITSMFTEAKACRDVAKEIQGIKERVREVADRRDRFNIDALVATANKTPIDPRITSLYAKVEPVGIGEAKEEVIARLTKGCNAEQQERIVVSIAGFGGLGKTTLAKAVHDEIKGQFHCTAFVSVSRNPDPKKLLRDMLYALDKEKFKDDIHSTMLHETHLIDLIREFLENKRYLIVIDDIWEREPWDKALGLSLMENYMRSRIITTTRNADVARHIGGYYRLKPLSVESSEMLFYGRIFGRKDKCPNLFSEVSERILKKCGGVPLAIVTISSLLTNKPNNMKVWEDVCDSVGSGLGRNDPGMDDMRKILLLSYYDLPSHLKTCLLYLSIFPEDYEIAKDGLIWRWVAEGFVQEKKGDQSFYEIGESYFNELINRSMIQPVDPDVDGTPHACRVHDTVLDLIVSLSEEECFITIVSGDGNYSSGINKQTIRRLSLHNYTNWHIMENMQKLRSISIFKPAGSVICSMPSHSYLLRVLDLRGCKLKGIASMRFIGSLAHLRYLGLSSSTKGYNGDAPHLRYLGLSSSTEGYNGYAPDQLPIEVGKLRFLQALDVSETMVEELPSNIVQLSQLMCLRGCRNSKFTTKLPVGVKNLTSLEVLEQVAVTSVCIAEELGHLTQLRVLEVRVTPLNVITKALVESLGKLKKIEDLCIYAKPYHIIDFGGSIMQGPLGNLGRVRFWKAISLPTWIKPSLLPGLSNLHVEVFRERKDNIQVLGTLPCLRHLVFLVLIAPKQGGLDRCVVGDDAFPCAVSCEFDIWDGPNLLPCTFPPGAMPRLQDLKFRICMEEFRTGGGCTTNILGLGHLPSLRSVTVYIGRDKDYYEVREKLEHEAAVHPNHPTIRFKE